MMFMKHHAPGRAIWGHRDKIKVTTLSKSCDWKVLGYEILTANMSIVPWIH